MKRVLNLIKIRKKLRFTPLKFIGLYWCCVSLQVNFCETVLCLIYFLNEKLMLQTHNKAIKLFL